MTRNRLLGAAVLASIILGAAWFLSIAREAGILDGDMSTRALMAASGLVIAMLGNSVPKQLKRPRTTVAAERRMQSGLRRVGWIMSLAGLAFALTWIVAPQVVAWPLSLSLMALGFLLAVVTILRCRTGRSERSAEIAPH